MEMMSKIRWIIFIAIAAIVLILISWGLFSIAQNIFSPADDNELASSENIDQDIVAGARSFSYTTVGPVVANVEHNSSLITVSENVVEMKIFQGYGNTVVSERSYQNTPESFSEFRSAMEKLDISKRLKGTDSEDDSNDEGFCPTGIRYIVEIDSSIRRWSTSCSTKIGTAGFPMSTVRQLFQKQVPDFNDINRNFGL